MSPRVISHDLTLVYHSPDQFSLTSCVVPCDEKHRLNLLIPEGIEDAAGVAVFISLVKCEADFLFCRLGQGVCVRVAQINEESAESAVFLLRGHRVTRPVECVVISALSPADFLPAE